MLKLSTHKFQCLMCEDNWKDLSIKKFLVHVFAKYKVFAETTANSLSPALSLIFPYKCCAWQWWLFRFSVQRFLSSCYGGRGRSAIVFSHSPPHTSPSFCRCLNGKLMVIIDISQSTLTPGLHIGGSARHVAQHTAMIR